MTEALSCDVLVVGAGPAGSTTARIAAEAGATVLLLERKLQVGVPVQCAGYVAKAIRWHLALPDDCTVQSVDGLRTFLPDGTVHETPSPGYTLDRAALDRHLALCAIRAGARLMLKAPVVGRGESGVIARMEGQILPIRASVIVGADGPRSLVARWMGHGQPLVARAIQYEVFLRRRLTTAEVYFRPEFRGGYGWVFPAGETARVGAAFVGQGRAGTDGLKRLLRELQAAGVISDSALSFTAGFVPVGGPTKLCMDNMLLVGDAAGHTHPITGAGILNAIIAGEMAGQTAAQAALSGDLSRLSDYAQEWDDVLGPVLARALQNRACLEEHWDSPPGELTRILRRSWFTFDDHESTVSTDRQRING